MIYDNKHCKFIHPCNVMIDGVTGSGKTILVRRILKNRQKLFHNLNKDVIDVLWCYGQFHELIDVSVENCNIKYVEGIPTREIIQEHKPDILVIDDLMSKMDKMEDLFTMIARHSKCSLFFLVQNMFYHAHSMKTIRNNCQYLIPMKFPQDESRMARIARQFVPNNQKFLIESYKRATSEAYGYIRIDCSPHTPDLLRIQSRITPEENGNIFLPTVYVPKNVRKTMSRED